MKDISERAFPKGHFDEGNFEGRVFPKGERAKGMKGIVHKLEFSLKDFSGNQCMHWIKAFPIQTLKIHNIFHSAHHSGYV